MLSQHTGVLARVLGATIAFATTYFLGFFTVATIAYSPHTPLWLNGVAFTLFGLASWSFTSLAEWLMSIEGGWYSLQRRLRIIQAAIVGGGFICVVFFKIYFLLM